MYISEKKERADMLVIITSIALALAVITTIGNVLGSSYCAEYGLTPPEMMKEVYLAIVCIGVSLVATVLIGRSKLPRIAIFGIRLLTVVLTVSFVHNQFAVSKELAPIKKEFAKAAAYNCKLKTRNELVCGNAVKDVLKKRDQKLSSLGAVSVNGWHVSMMRTKTTKAERSGVYILVPFL